MGPRPTPTRLSVRVLTLLVSALAPLVGHAETELDRGIAQAVEDINAGRFREAIERLEPLAQASDDPAVRFYLADASIRAGDEQRANQMLTEFYASFGRAERPERYQKLVGLSAQLADRLYGWEAVRADDDAELRGALWGGLITSGAAAVVLGAVAVVGATQTEEAEPFDEPADPGGDSDLSTRSSDSIAGGATATVAGIGAGVAALTAIGCGIGLLVLDDAPAVEVSPRLDDDGAAAGALITVQGRF